MEKKTSHLVLVRHGQSEWNEKNLFTGWKNPPLTPKGIIEAKNAGIKIKSLDINFDIPLRRNIFHFFSNS